MDSNYASVWTPKEGPTTEWALWGAEGEQPTSDDKHAFGSLKKFIQEQQAVWWSTANEPASAQEDVVSILAKSIPGFTEMRQKCPESKFPTGACCVFNTTISGEDLAPQLRSTIVHLNDRHKWTRERIADWLETLDHDLTFKVPEEVNT